MHKIFKKLDKDNPKELVAKVRILLMYYGLLRQNEVLKIRVMDVTTKDNQEIIVRYCFATKSKSTGFKFYVPEHLIPAFWKYLSQIKNIQSVRGTRFPKNYNLNGNCCTQNLGTRMVGYWIAAACKTLNISKIVYTSHSFRRSTATVLADNGCTIMNLKHHGRCSSDAVAEGYINNYRPMKMNQVLLLYQAHSNMSEYPNPNTSE